MSLRSLNPRMKYIWVGMTAFLSLIAGTILTAFLYGTIGAAAVAFTVFLPAIGALYGLKRYSNWGFEVRDDHLYIEHGVLKKTYSMVPYVRVQHIDTDRGPIDRVLGLSKLRVYTAGSKGADIKIPGIAKDEASQLQEKLRDSAIASEKGFDAV